MGTVGTVWTVGGVGRERVQMVMECVSAHMWACSVPVPTKWEIGVRRLSDAAAVGSGIQGPMRSLGSVFLMVVTVLATGPALAAPASDGAVDAAVEGLVQARVQAEEDHLRRLGIWGAASVLGGAGLLALSMPGVVVDDGAGALQGFGIQSVAWGTINLAIVGIGAVVPRAPITDRDDALAAEDDLAKVLWVNVGLDVGYLMVGGTLAAASQLGAEPRVDVFSHGVGIATQGAGLLVLDLIAVWSSDPREQALAALPPSAHPMTP